MALFPLSLAGVMQSLGSPQSLGVHLSRSVHIAGEEHWIVDQDNVVDFRSDDPIHCADGNDIFALRMLFDESLIN